MNRKWNLEIGCNKRKSCKPESTTGMTFEKILLITSHSWPLIGQTWLSSTINLEIINGILVQVKWGPLSRWSFGLNFAWGSIETIIGNTQPTLWWINWCWWRILMLSPIIFSSQKCLRCRLQEKMWLGSEFCHQHQCG